MNILKQLKTEHEEVAALFDQLENTQSHGHKLSVNKTRKDLFVELELKLRAHTEIEETSLYVPMKKARKIHAETRDAVLEAYEEHTVAKYLLDSLKKTPSTNEKWGAKLTTLREIIEHHVKEEQEELFPDARALFSSEQLDKMGETYLERKDKWLSRHGGKQYTRKSLALTQPPIQMSSFPLFSLAQSETGRAAMYVVGWFLGVPTTLLFLIFLVRNC